MASRTRLGAVRRPFFVKWSVLCGIFDFCQEKAVTRTSLGIWGGQDFRESFSESCGDLAKGRKSTKVAGGARASGYSIVLASKILRFQAPKSPIP